MDGVGVGVPISSGRLGRRVFALSSAVSGGEAGAAFGFAAEGGVTGTLGAVRGIAFGRFGVGDAAGALSLGGCVAAGVVDGTRGGADGRCAGVKEGRCFTTDSGCVDGVPVATGVLIGGGGTLRCDCTGGVLSVVAGDAAGLIVAVGAGTIGGVARKSMAGVGRTLGGIEAVAIGEAEIAGAAAVGEGDATTAGAIEGLTFG